ncbi:MAG: S-layer homology domain-containing protein [Firmicutes bacterium]|nr:S-layer homology domain-containing protein [Bacillota bacterium]
MKLKKVFKKFICLTVVLAVVATPLGFSHAEISLSSALILDLQAFNVIEGDVDGGELGKNITRAEFSEMLHKLLNSDDQSLSGSASKYADVPGEHRYLPAIGFLTAMGIIDGDVDGNFHPERNLTVLEASIMLVRLLGYEPQAKNYGGYPEGYLISAGYCRLLNGVSTPANELITYCESLYMIFNALNANRLITSHYRSDGAHTLKSGDTLRNYLLNKEDDTFKVRGVVTANYDSWLLAPNVNLRDDEIMIDDVVIRAGNTDAASYLGLTVDAYVVLEESTNKYIIKSILPDERNNIIDIIENKDIISLTNEEVSYEQNKQIITKKIAPNVDLLYNGLPRDWASINTEELMEGYITFISNDGGSEYNVLLFNEYQSFVVSSVNPESYRINFSHDKRLNGKSGIILKDDRNIYLKSYIYDADNNPVAIEDITPGDTVSIFIDVDETLIKVYVSRSQIDGIIEEFSLDPGFIVIGGATYDLGKSFAQESGFNKFLGKEVTINLDYRGNVVYVSEGVLSDLNYIALLSVRDRTMQSPLAKVLYGNVFSDSEEEPSPDSYSGSVPAIAAKNKGIGTLEFADRVSFEDETGIRSLKTNEITPFFQAMLDERTNVGGTAIKSTSLPLKYQLNAKGQITQLTAPKLVGRDWQVGKKYNAYEKTFSGDVGNGAYGIRNRTIALCLPQINQESEDDNYLADIELNNNQFYSIEGYDFDEDSACVALIVISASMIYDVPGSSISKYGIVYKMSKKLDEEEKERTFVKIITSKGPEDFFVSEHAGGYNFSGLRTGQLIEYSLNNSNELDAYTLIQHLDSSVFKAYTSIDVNSEVFVGDIADVRYNRVSELLNRKVDIINMSDGMGFSKNYDVQISSPPPVFVYNLKNDTARLGTHDEFMDNALYVVVYATSVSSSDPRVVPRAIVIVQ